MNLKPNLQSQNRAWAIKNPGYLESVYQRIRKGLPDDLQLLTQGSELVPALQSDLLPIVLLQEPHLMSGPNNQRRFMVIATAIAEVFGVGRIGISCGVDRWAAIRLVNGCWVIADAKEAIA